MIVEVQMSPDEDNPEEQKKKKYLWLGYGGYSGPGVMGPINPGNIRADPSIFDKLLELFGIREKPGKEAEKNQDGQSGQPD
jgi:hypothetical protein